MPNLKSRPWQIGLLATLVVAVIIGLVIANSNNETKSPTDQGSDTTPTKTSPAAYTKFVVDQAISRYQDQGLDNTLAHYNDPANIDGQWYTFIIDENNTVVGHYDPSRRGLDIRGAVGIDINGYNFGQRMIATDETGQWVPYVYANPASGQLGDRESFELKNTWVIKHDGLLFASGWYVNTEEFIPQLMIESSEHFRSGGFEALVEFYEDPANISVGLTPVAEYYNHNNSLEGFFSGFSVDPDGQILSHIDPELVGTDIEDLLGPAVKQALAEGGWITADDNPDGVGPERMRVWVINVDDTLIGGGWYSQDN